MIDLNKTLKEMQDNCKHTNITNKAWGNHKDYPNEEPYGEHMVMAGHCDDCGWEFGYDILYSYQILPDSVLNPKPKFITAKSALKYYNKLIDSIAVNKGCTAEELQLLADSNKLGDDESFDIRRLFRRIRALEEVRDCVGKT